MVHNPLRGGSCAASAEAEKDTKQDADEGYLAEWDICSLCPSSAPPSPCLASDEYEAYN